MAAPIKFPFRPRGGQPREDTTPKRGLRRYLLELKESNKEFWLSGHAVFKLLSLGCMISALDYFETMLPHPVLILLICMEAAICIFFIFLNTLAINRYIPFVFWPMAVVTVTSMIFFIVGQAPEPYIVITGFEVTIIFCFVVLYMCRRDKIMKSFFWPLLVSDELQP
uniref:CKLF-like MARVEL transmembrane domain containing 2A n=1 Tax=Mus musculus TaxID=10090 RepID=A0A1D5RLI2_MOUSE